MLQRLRDLAGSIDSLARAQARTNDLLEAQNEHLRKLVWEAQTSRKTQQRAIVHASTREVMRDVREFARSRQLSMLDTVYAIRDESLSFVRFGDGEIRFMLRQDHNQAFQRNSIALAGELRDALAPANRDGVLLGFPHLFNDMHWSTVWPDIWDEFKEYVEPWNRLGVAHVTRPIFFQATGERGVEAWRSVWDGKSVTVVTGRNSRFEFLPELFDGVTSKTEVLSEPINAFDDVPRLVEELKDNKSDLILIALGPAGTILTSKLAGVGRQAIDVGHISDSYQHVFNGDAYPESKPTMRS